MTPMTQSTSASQTASVVQTTSSGQGSVLGFAAGAASSNLFSLNWSPFAQPFNRPLLAVTPSPTKAGGSSVTQSQAPQASGSQQVSVTSRTVTSSPAAQHSPQQSTLMSPVPQPSSPASPAVQHSSPASSPPPPPPPPPHWSTTNSTSVKPRALSQSLQLASRMPLPQPPTSSALRGPPVPYTLQLPLLSNFSASSASRSSSTHVSQSSAGAPPQPSMGWGSSSSSAVRAAPAHVSQSSTGAALQRSTSLSTTRTTPATPSFGVPPPRVNLLNRLMISHCFQLLVLSPIISMN